MSSNGKVTDGWTSATIEALAEPKGVAYGVLKPGPQVSNGVPMLRVTDVKDGSVDSSAIYRISSTLNEEFRRTKLHGGEIVLSIQGTVGRAAVVPQDLAGANISRTLAMIRLTDPALAPWIHRALESPHMQQAMRDVVGGTTRDSFNLRDLRQLEIPIAPESVRDAILDLIGRADQLRRSSASHLASARRSVGRLRQAILIAACTGRLTAAWRTTTPLAADASELVAMIEESRRQRLGRRFKAPVIPTRDTELPKGWVWTTIGALVDVATGATPLRKRADYYGGTTAWITSGAVNQGLITSATEYITELALKETNAKVFPPGTLLVAMYGEGQTRGRVAELGMASATNQAVAALLFDEPSERLRPYLRLFLLENYERIRQLSFGGVQPNLSLGVIKDTPVPLPPGAEQLEIVRVAERLLEGADRLEERIAAAETRIERGSQAVLAKAFRGELGASVTDR